MIDLTRRLFLLLFLLRGLLRPLATRPLLGSPRAPQRCNVLRRRRAAATAALRAGRRLGGQHDLQRRDLGLEVPLLAACGPALRPELADQPREPLQLRVPVRHQPPQPRPRVLGAALAPQPCGAWAGHEDVREAGRRGERAPRHRGLLHASSPASRTHGPQIKAAPPRPCRRAPPRPCRHRERQRSSGYRPASTRTQVQL